MNRKKALTIKPLKKDMKNEMKEKNSTTSFSSKYEEFMKIKNKMKNNNEDGRRYNSLDSTNMNLDLNKLNKFGPSSPSLRSPRHNLRKNLRKTTTESSLEEHKKIYLEFKLNKLPKRNEGENKENKKKKKLYRSFSDPMIIPSWDMFDLEDYGQIELIDKPPTNERWRQFQTPKDCKNVMLEWAKDLANMPENLKELFQNNNFFKITSYLHKKKKIFK